MNKLVAFLFVIVYFSDSTRTQPTSFSPRSIPVQHDSAKGTNETFKREVENSDSLNQNMRNSDARNNSNRVTKESASEPLIFRFGGAEAKRHESTQNTLSGYGGNQPLYWDPNFSCRLLNITNTNSNADINPSTNNHSGSNTNHPDHSHHFGIRDQTDKRNKINRQVFKTRNLDSDLKTLLDKLMNSNRNSASNTYDIAELSPNVHQNKPNFSLLGAKQDQVNKTNPSIFSLLGLNENQANKTNPSIFSLLGLNQNQGNKMNSSVLRFIDSKPKRDLDTFLQNIIQLMNSNNRNYLTELAGQVYPRKPNYSFLDLKQNPGNKTSLIKREYKNWNHKIANALDIIIRWLEQEVLPEYESKYEPSSGYSNTNNYGNFEGQVLNMLKNYHEGYNLDNTYGYRKYSSSSNYTYPNQFNYDNPSYDNSSTSAESYNPSYVSTYGGNDYYRNYNKSYYDDKQPVRFYDSYNH